MFFQKHLFKICGIISSSPLPCSHISAYKLVCRKYKHWKFKTTTSNLPTKPTDWWTWKPCTMKPAWNTHWKWNGYKNRIFPRNILQSVSTTFTRTSGKNYLFQTLSRANGLLHSQLYSQAKNGGGKKPAALYGLSLPEYCRFACLFLPEPFYSAVPKIHALNTETIPESAVP